MSVSNVGSSNPDDHELHGVLSSRFNIDVLDDAANILCAISKSIPPFHSTLSACIGALQWNKRLYEELKASHRRKNYDAIRNWVDFCTAAPRRAATPSSSVEETLIALKPRMVLLVHGELNLRTWTPPASLASQLDPRTTSHLVNLQLPCLREKPNLLLHQLGYFGREPELQNRVQNLFMPDTPSHTIFVNTSGSGKTRLLLEGLCQHWGFYFTSLVDSTLIGSCDLQMAIKTVSEDPLFNPELPSPNAPRYKSVREMNEKIAERVFKRVFLARALIFDLFLEAMVKVPDAVPVEEFRRRWLLLQLHPKILRPDAWDVFNDLARKVAPFSDAFVNSKTEEILSKLRTILSEAGGRAESLPLYCVIDEAQFAATEYTYAFRSSSVKDRRSILRPLIKAISGLTVSQGVFLLLAGTGLSQSHVEATVASAVNKNSTCRSCMDTGSFEGWDGMAPWVERFVPEWVFSGKGGERLKERMGYWLTGRHRFAAGYVTELLADGFRTPHRLLNAYIHEFTGFEPSDGRDAVEEETAESFVLEKRYKLDFTKLKGGMLKTISDLSAHYLMHSTLPSPLCSDELYVEYGFARFKHPETELGCRTRSKSRAIPMAATMDEPLVLLAANHWFDTESTVTSYKYFAKRINNNTSLKSNSSPSNGFEDFIVYCIDLLFATKPRRRVKDVFEFYGTVPHWAGLTAELVSLYTLPTPPLSCSAASARSPLIEQATVKHTRFSGPSATLGTNANSPDSTIEWLSHRSRIPVCFPCRSMGPDVMFVLKLEDGKLVWVALQAKLSEGRGGKLERKVMNKAVRSVTPKNFFLNKDRSPFSPVTHPDLVEDTLKHLAALPNKCEGSGKYSLLRAIASFPARADLERPVDKKDPSAAENLEDIDDGHPIATLDMGLIKEVTKFFSPVDVLEELQPKTGMGAGNTNGRKRKPASGAGGGGEGSSAAKKRKIKLN